MTYISTPHFLKLLITVYKLQKILMTHNCHIFLIFCLAILNVSKMPQISASNNSLFKPRLIFFSCYFFIVSLFFYTIVALVLLSIFNPSHQSFKWVILSLISRITLFLFLIISFSETLKFNIAQIGLVFLTILILNFIKTSWVSCWQ